MCPWHVYITSCLPDLSVSGESSVLPSSALSVSPCVNVARLSAFQPVQNVLLFASLFKLVSHVNNVIFAARACGVSQTAHINGRRFIGTTEGVAQSIRTPAGVTLVDE